LKIFSGVLAATSSMSMPPAGLTIITGDWLARSTMTPTYASLAMSAAGATSTFSTVSPLIFIPRMRPAISAACWGVSASLTPPALPRPPACTCAALVATSPGGTGMPAVRSSSRA
jgi:hypothetical protein